MKKYSSGSFVDAAYGVYGSAADNISSFPATIYADGQNASAIINGNMQQSGTPTPSSPIYPSETGDLESTGEHAGQYKIPISSASTTTPVYLGEVQSTRQIKQLVLTGTNADGIYGDTAEGVIYITPFPTLKNVNNAYCTHYEYFAQSQGSIMPNNSFTTMGGAGTSLWFKTEYTIAGDFKTYLAQQYANGTPVCVWYILAESTTNIVNEPLRKIGDYVDSVAAAPIPTTSGSQTFSIDTTLKPSSVTLTYTGWHTHRDKKYSGGSWGAVTNGQILRRKRTTKSKT